VAERAGVSVGSASQAFGRPELVSDDVRKKVLEAAEALGYPGPDPVARRLRTGRAGAIGLIFAERLGYPFTDPAAPAFLRGIARGMEETPTGLLLVPDSRYREEAARVVREAAVDGFIVYSTPQNDPRFEAALGRRLPIVTVDQPRGAETPFVGIDDRGAARSAAEHLRELGHDRVGVLSFVTTLDPGASLELDLTNERLAGYEEGLGDAWDAGLVRTVRPNAPEPAREATLELLRSPSPPTAILAMSDILALGVLEAATELEVQVPEQLSVVGFDDGPVAEHASPSLTTVAQPQEEKGQVAAQWLLEDVERGASPARGREEILPTELVVRASTAPPRGS
jgi:DNA-binding LacI/PurR family transcriptional regulator